MVDTNFLLNNSSILENIMQTGEFVLIIPNPVLSEISGITRSSEPCGEIAKHALTKYARSLKRKVLEVVRQILYFADKLILSLARLGEWWGVGRDYVFPVVTIFDQYCIGFG